MHERRVYVGARVSLQLRDLVKKVAEQRGMNMSDLIRFLVRRELAEFDYLTNDVKKAFGIQEVVSDAGD